MAPSIAHPMATTNTGRVSCPLWCAVDGHHIEGMHSVEKIVRVGDQHVQVVMFQDLTESENDAYLNLQLVDEDGTEISEPETLGTHLVKNAALSAVLAGVVAS